VKETGRVKVCLFPGSSNFEHAHTGANLAGVHTSVVYPRLKFPTPCALPAQVWVSFSEMRMSPPGGMLQGITGRCSRASHGVWVVCRGAGEGPTTLQTPEAPVTLAPGSGGLRAAETSGWKQEC
jgi:hypothetical protein